MKKTIFLSFPDVFIPKILLIPPICSMKLLFVPKVFVLSKYVL